MEIKKVYEKKRAEFGKQCIFDITGPTLDVDIHPDPTLMHDYIVKSYCHTGVHHSKQLALHEVQTTGTTKRNAGMFHFEGGWPKEINPRDEEATARLRRRIEKDDNWAPKLHNLFEMMEQSVLQNGAVNIYQHYFDDMVPTELVQPLGLRAANIYADPETPTRPVSNISWSPDAGSRLVVSYCFLEFGRQPDYSNRVYIWQVDNPNAPYMALEPFCPCVVCEFNPRDPSVLASGLMTGQVCNWDIRTGRSPVQSSNLQFSHRDYANAVKWLPTKSNTEFFSTSSDGRAMWWDTRWIRKPTEILLFDMETPNEPNMDRAIGVSCLNYGPMIGTKFVFGMDNGIIISGSRKAKTNAEKLAVRFEGHYGPVVSVDRNVFNPAVFLSVGDWTARIWSEDTREGNLVSTFFLEESPTAGCWNKLRHSVFYVATDNGSLIAWDVLQNLRNPIFTLKLCNERLTAIAPSEETSYVAIGNSVGQVFLVETTDYLKTFERKDRASFSEYMERCSKLTKAVDVRLREIKLVQKIQAAEKAATKAKEKVKPKRKAAVEVKRKESHPGGKDRRKSGQKEPKRKPREELPTAWLLEAEQKFFEIVTQEIDKYIAEDDPEICPARPQIGVSKKQDRRQRAKSHQEEDKSKDSRRKTTRKFSAKEVDASKKRRPRKQKSQSEVGLLASKQSLRGASSAMSRSRMLTGEAEGKKKKKQKIKFLLPVPCKGEVCKPKVCCYRNKRRKKRTRKSDADKSRSKIFSSQAKLTGVSSVTLSKTPGRGSSRYSPRASVLSKMLDLPFELTQEVERARREIREGRLSSGGRRSRYSERESEESRMEPSSEERSLLSVEDDHDEESMDEDTRTEEAIEEVDETKKTARSEVTLDPCSPPKGKSLAEEFSAMLGVPMPTSIEDRVEGSAYLQELEAVRSRVYPRISEFHSIE